MNNMSGEMGTKVVNDGSGYSEEMNDIDGGRRRKKGGKGTKKRKENPVLASWRKFVRKVQHEEKITYPEAMKRASKRKSEWQRGGSVEAYSNQDSYASANHSNVMAPAIAGGNGPVPMIAGKSRRMRGGNHPGPVPMIAGKSRRKRGGSGAAMAVRGGSKKRRGSRRR
jgi:hypothetical protein